MIGRFILSGCLLAGLSVGAASVRADGIAGETGAPQAKSDGLVVTLGGWGLVEPNFEGAGRYSFAPRPILDIRGVNDKDWLSLPKDGFGLDLYETGNFHMGLVGNWRWALGVHDQRGFKHIGSVDVSVEAGGFAEYWPADWLRTRVELRRAFLGADGSIADVSSDLVWRPDRAWTFTAGPRLSFADKEFMNAYYGVTPQQSTASGLRQFDASAGLRAYGAGTFAKYKWSEQVSTMGFIEYERLSGETLESPLLTSTPGVRHNGSADQFTFGLGLSYSFVLGGFK